jgi:2-amino-4-hydroxy-6-hydroxymethyldihydropteridine diphosphokinase
MGNTKSQIVFVAIGANLGEPKRNVWQAMERLQQLSDESLLKSSLWETAPVDCPAGSPKFVNAVTGLVPRGGETPESLLLKLKALEKEFGRAAKKELNEPRPLDLDLIAWGEQTMTTRDLILPHPRAHLRRFVLEPLSELAPEFVLPGQSKTVTELLASLPADANMKRT